MSLKACTDEAVLHSLLTIADISLETNHLEGNLIPDGASLRFLSIVETGRIPLYLSLSPPCSVTTCDTITQRWFSHVLLANSPDSCPIGQNAWWRNACSDSSLGVLVSIEAPAATGHHTKSCSTEVLFYASRGSNAAPPTPSNSYPIPTEDIDEGKENASVRVSALILSSHLLHYCQEGEPTPPSTPVDQLPGAVFLSDVIHPEAEKIHEPPIHKRKTADQAFDEANERRKKARRRGGQGVAAAVAAAPNSEKQMPSLQHRRSTSTIQVVPLQTRSLSRSPSIASSRPATANRPSALSTVENSASQPGESDIERKNKDVISRIVMAGMRLYGLAQSKKRNPRDSTSLRSPCVDEGGESIEAQRQSDEEYKLIYHQVFKGTCVGFRATIRSVSLQPLSARVRDVVDHLLTIFCTDPLGGGLGQMDEKLTPGGRKAFAAADETSTGQAFKFAYEQRENSAG